MGQPAMAADIPPAQVQQVTAPSNAALGSASRSAPALAEYKLPEGNEWRYSDFVQAVKKQQVERVRFAKDGSSLQLTAINGINLYPVPAPFTVPLRTLGALNA